MNVSLKQLKFMRLLHKLIKLIQNVKVYRLYKTIHNRFVHDWMGNLFDFHIKKSNFPQKNLSIFILYRKNWFNTFSFRTNERLLKNKSNYLKGNIVFLQPPQDVCTGKLSTFSCLLVFEDIHRWTLSRQIYDLP